MPPFAVGKTPTRGKPDPDKSWTGYIRERFVKALASVLVWRASRAAAIGTVSTRNALVGSSTTFDVVNVTACVDVNVSSTPCTGAPFD